MKKKFAALILCALIALAAFIGCSAETDGEEALHVIFYKVGKADCAIVLIGDKSVVIDTGEEDDAEELAAAFKRAGVKDTIDTVVLTHYDKDHIGGAEAILNAFTVNNIIMPDYTPENKRYESLLENEGFIGAEVTRLKAGKESEDIPALGFEIDGAHFNVYASAEEYDGSDEADNELSLIVSLTYGEKHILFTADAPADRLTQVCLAEGVNYDIIKAPAHGEYSEQYALFYAEAKAANAVICCSKKNPADEKTVEAVAKAGGKVYFTYGGDIVVTVNGGEITVKQ